MSTSTTGTLITNSQRQLERSSSPPSSGPSKKATPKTAPMSPSIRPRRSRGTVSAMTAAATGSKPPAPNAWIARPSNNAGNDQAAAATKEPMPNSARLSRNTRRRPDAIRTLREQRRADQIEQHVTAEDSRQPARPRPRRWPESPATPARRSQCRGPRSTRPRTGRPTWPARARSSSSALAAAARARRRGTAPPPPRDRHRRAAVARPCAR